MTQMTGSKPASVDPSRLRLTNEEGTQGALLGVRCGDCGMYAFGQAVFCSACASGNLEAVVLSPRGTLYSYTIVWVPPPGWPGTVPYVLGQTELPEGPHVLAEVIDCRHDKLAIGMPVELVLHQVRSEDSGVDLVVYKWRPAGDLRGDSR